MAFGRGNGAGDAGLTPGLIPGERGRGLGLGEAGGQHPGILERHVGALGQERQRRMRGVADQCETRAMPAGGDLVTEEAPEMDLADPRQQVGDVRAETGEGGAQIFRIVPVRPAFGGPVVTLLDRDDVAEPAAAQRIGHKVAARPEVDPRCRIRPAGFGHQRAPGDLTGEMRRGGAVQQRPRGGMEPVGRHGQTRAAGAKAAGLGPDLGGRAQPDLDPGGLGPLRQNLDQIGAVKEQVVLIGGMAGQVQPGHPAPGEARRPVRPPRP